MLLSSSIYFFQLQFFFFFMFPSAALLKLVCFSAKSCPISNNSPTQKPSIWYFSCCPRFHCFVQMHVRVLESMFLGHSFLQHFISTDCMHFNYLFLCKVSRKKKLFSFSTDILSDYQIYSCFLPHLLSYGFMGLLATCVSFFIIFLWGNGFSTLFGPWKPCIT